MNQLHRFRWPLLLLALVAGIVLLLNTCPPLTERRAAELVRLKYRQLHTAEGGGQWLLDSITVLDIRKLKGDTFRVYAAVTGLYERAPASSGQYPVTPFRDTVFFSSWRARNVWVARRWYLTGTDRR